MALDTKQVVDAAVELLDDEGLDAVSFRRLASRLAIQGPTLYWYIDSKTALLDALADAIMDEAIRAMPTSGPDDDWAEWMLDVLVQLRSALLRHRDGARVVAGARLALRRADFSEAVLSALVDHGVELQRARLLTLAGERFTVGYVLEEQAPTDMTQPAPEMEALQRRLPRLVQAIGEYFSSGRSSDDLFRDTASVILGVPQQ